MRSTDLRPFTEILDATYALLNRGVKPAEMQASMFFRALADHDLATVRAAFDAHMRDPQRGRFAPVPADILAQIHAAAADDSRPGAEEAWAIAMRSQDEADTVVWTEEISEARGIAKPILDAGDEVGARMAFKEAYLRLVAEARSTGRPTAWSASLGFDSQMRQVALEQAVAANRLPKFEALQLQSPVSAPLLGMAQAFGAPAHVIASLKALADKLRERAKDEPSADVLAKADTQQRQAETAEKVEQYTAERGITP